MKFPLVIILCSLLAGEVLGDGETWPGMLCFWDADHEQQKACASFELDCYNENNIPPYYGDTVVICKDSAANFREISYEIVICRYGLICENCGVTKSVKIKVCKVSVNPPQCTERTEKVWRYMAYGNDSPVPRTGNVHGRLYQAGTYEISWLFTWQEDSIDPELSTDYDMVKVIQLSKCDGSQNITLY